MVRSVGTQQHRCGDRRPGRPESLRRGRTVRDLFDAGSAFRIPPLGSRVLRSAGAIRRGWIEVESDSAAVSGLLTYRQAETGVEVSVKPLELGSQFALFVEETPAIGAGVAIFRPDASPNVELRVRDEEGNDPLNGVFIPRGGFHQLARTLPEWLGAGGVDTGFLEDFRGLLFLRSADDSRFAPLGLRFGKTNASLSSVPAVRIMDGDGIGEYHFTNALRYRLHTAGGGEGSALVVAQAKSLLLWGGVGSDGTPFLEPAFVVDAVAAMPRSEGEFEIIGRDADGEELFSFSFSMPKVADGDGRSSLVFALPVRPGWDEELASISLSGPGGAVRLDEETDRPVTILRDSGTGEIRGILRGVAGGSGSGDDAVSALALEPGVEVLVSRGIPEAEDWSR